MNESPLSTQKYFLCGIIGIGALIIAGLVWAILAGPSQTGNGTVERNLRFNDENDPIVGSTSTRVVVRIFGDFQCPACGTAEAGVTHARRTYGDQVRFVWNDFPLSQIHSNAMAAARAARCAEMQGKFWEYHDALYRYQPLWSSLADPSDVFKGYARELKIAEEPFAACLVNHVQDKKILDDVNEGHANRVDSTPTFFVNAKRIVGVLTAEDWDRELKPLVGS
ncbi:MAG: thioredoxin domain-containing protein [Patescibacteria group bacterium]